MKLFFNQCRIVFFLIITILYGSTVLAQGILLKLPVDCQLNHDCYIPHYVDRDSTSGFMDFRGGRLTYDAHKGTDIALKTYEQMRQKVAVLAAADGVVLRIRDGETDYYRNQGTPAKGKECGNGLILLHKWGYKSQYCHFLNNSIAVKPGLKVYAGQVLGFVGSSGKADFPHLHFALYLNDHIVDPFDPNLWNPPIEYKPFGLIDMGLHNRNLEQYDVLDIPPRRKIFSRNDSKIVVWVRVFGVLKGDRQRFIFYQPNGQIYHSLIERTIEQSYKEYFAFSGYRVKGKFQSLLKGKWKSVYQLKRSNQPWKTLGEQTFILK